MARKLYREVIEQDLQHGAITLELLKMARDPGAAFLNLTEKADALDVSQLIQDKAEALKARLDAEMSGGHGLENVTKETVR